MILILLALSIAPSFADDESNDSLTTGVAVNGGTQTVTGPGAGFSAEVAETTKVSKDDMTKGTYHGYWGAAGLMLKKEETQQAFINFRYSLGKFEIRNKTETQHSLNMGGDLVYNSALSRGVASSTVGYQFGTTTGEFELTTPLSLSGPLLVNTLRRTLTVAAEGGYEDFKGSGHPLATLNLGSTLGFCAGLDGSAKRSVLCFDLNGTAKVGTEFYSEGNVALTYNHRIADGVEKGTGAYLFVGPSAGIAGEVDSITGKQGGGAKALLNVGVAVH